MVQSLGEAVEGRSYFNESARDKNRLAAGAALPDFLVASIWTGVSF